MFKDIIPGYRIRALTDLEKAEKVSQMVQRTRDWEQGLVGVYQSYLRSLEAELKGNVHIKVKKILADCIRVISQKRASRSCFAVHVRSPSRSDSLQLSRQSYERCSGEPEQEVVGQGS